MGAAAREPGVPSTAARARSRILVQGVVQGVGFRPFVYALARELALAGEVGNTADGVRVEVEGDVAAVAEFTTRVRSDAPVLAMVESVVAQPIEPLGGTDFSILESTDGPGRTLISPDFATCDECLGELADPTDRRYRHAFISCTNCGPRFTVITDLPYDRPGTTMAELPLCTACAKEYADPADRRFHAQTVACPDCGPTLVLRQPGEPDRAGPAALAHARQLLAAGLVVAVKGLGGYHLACDATDDAAVATLRKRKDRGDKPFAVMVADLDTARLVAAVSPAEAALLVDPRRPVVLLQRRVGTALALSDEVAPAMSEIGVMVAYTPVHHLLFGLPGDERVPRALVMTSGNVSGEPIVIDDGQSLDRLYGLADAWLMHDRSIAVPCDDSVVRVVGGQQLPVRRSRGYAPLPIALPLPVRPALAVGGDLKNAFCVGDGGYAWLSGHVGDMDDLATLSAFETATAHLQRMTGVCAEVLVSDQHPAYRSARWAERHSAGRPLRRVQHHHAHIASAMAENGHDGSRPVIGFAFDGTGFGDDGAVWGGELLVADYDGYRRAAHLRYAWLPGGDAGVRNPCRMALSHLSAAGLDWDARLPSVQACSLSERTVLTRQLETGLNSVPTSSMGRLFDAVSSLAGVCHRIAYEAEAAMRFESLAHESLAGCGAAYRFALGAAEPFGSIGPAMPLVVDPTPVLAAAIEDLLAGVGPGVVAARFHLAVAEMVVRLAEWLRAETGLGTVALSGGVFLNVLLTRLCLQQLQDSGFRVLSHHLVPPSDAGLALGQLMVGARAP